MRPIFSPFPRRLLAALLSAALIPTVMLGADQNPPLKMTYQGNVVDSSGTPLASTSPENHTIDFNIYDQSSGGTAIWHETQLVTIDKGAFSVVLGDGTVDNTKTYKDLASVFSGGSASDRYIEITVTLANSVQTTLAPRLRLVTSPYSFLAKNAVQVIDPAGNAVLTTAANQVQINRTGVPRSTLDVGGIVTADKFVGDGSSLTGITAGQVPSLDASKISSGTLAVNLIPALDASKVTTGTFDSARIPSLDASKISSGTLAVGRLPSDVARVNTALPGGFLARGGTPGANGVNNNGYAFSGNSGDNDSGMFSTADGLLQFYLNSGEAMRLNGNGLGVINFIGSGTTTPSDPLHIRISYNAGIRLENTTAAYSWKIYTSNTKNLLFLNDDGSNYRWFSPDGNLNGSSDRRLKKDITELGPILDKVLKLKPVTFRMKKSADGSPKETGFIAQEVEPLFPELVSEEEGFKGLNYTAFGTLAIAALQELAQQVDVLKGAEARVVELEKKTAELEKKAARVEALESELGELRRLVARVVKASSDGAETARVKGKESSPVASR